MWGSVPVYAGGFIALVGVVLVLKPAAWLGIRTRRRALLIVAAGALLTLIGLRLPVSEHRITRAETQLDRFAPAWQFREVHSLRIAAPPTRVYEAIQRVRADEISLFRALTWIRRGGRALPPGILNAGNSESLIDVATSSGFVRLADSTPHELVIGTVVIAPAGVKGTLTPDVFQQELPAGFALATMNFRVTPDGADGSVVVTETRVYANSPDAQRRFAAYWRIIYPGSAIIRRMWLRAIRHRATQAPAKPEPPFRAVLAAGFLAVIGITLYHRLRSWASKERLDRRKEGLFILATLRPVGLLLWLGVIAYLVNPEWMAWSSVPLPAWLRWTGVVLFALGVALLTWALQGLGTNLTDTVVTRQAHTLVTHGPYRWVRHPFYDAMALLILAIALIAANWFVLVTGATVFALLAVRSRTEEAMLLERFGEPYRAYRESTGRFLPKMCQTP